MVGRLGIADPRGEADIVGEAPNLAAHLQKAAEPDSIVTTAAVRALAGSRFAFEPAGEVENPALGRRMPLFRVLGPIPGVGRTRPLRADRLYGREEEQARLDHAWREVSGGRGRAVALIGEAGIGKSALLGHLRRTVAATGGLWHAAFCQPEGAASPLLPVRELARSLLGSQGERRLAGLAARSSEESEGLGLLARLLAAGPSPAGDEALGAVERLRRLAAGLRALVRVVAHGRPVALVVEDAHWADDASRGLLAAFAEGLRGLPVLLALSAREQGFAPPAALGAEGVIRLAPLARSGDGGADRRT
ncbi:MAG: ATP-binding protein [Acetobacteraceae bacterium]|nr:ATP-binding protein [Acetobacteraceae bacterium]